MQKNIIQISDQIFQILADDKPEPKIELEYINPYTLLVAVILSAQATDVGVNKATKTLFQYITTPEDMVNLGKIKLKKYIRTIGLFNSKAKNIIAMSQMLITEYNSQVPDNLTDLMSLPGVGRKSANVILNSIFHQPTMAVDTHVKRVSNRLGLAQSDNLLIIEEQLLNNINKRWLQYAHHWLVLHGRYICKARKPLCKQCKITHLCHYFRENSDK